MQNITNRPEVTTLKKGLLEGPNHELFAQIKTWCGLFTDKDLDRAGLHPLTSPSLDSHSSMVESRKFPEKGRNHPMKDVN